ncbi:MAG: hypothetical protein QUU85_10065, partial [Candidatus Eisenbacteria bacterium]|nr:hypothetical protein [Candidatus Eisenbacteria bacterium]
MSAAPAGRGEPSRAPRWDPVWNVRIRPARILLVLVLLAAAVVLSLPGLLTSYARWLMVSDPHRNAEVAIVLGGGEGERLGAALRIWREGRVPALLITGPDKALLPVYTGGQDSLSQGEVKRRIAIRRGMQPENVWLLLGPTSTYCLLYTSDAADEFR